MLLFFFLLVLLHFLNSACLLKFFKTIRYCLFSLKVESCEEAISVGGEVLVEYAKGFFGVISDLLRCVNEALLHGVFEQVDISLNNRLIEGL